MNPKHTCIWAAIAAALFAFIFFFERHLLKPPPGPQPMLSGIKTAAVTKFIVQHTGQPEIRAERTNDSWVVVKSAALPAQGSVIEGVLGALEQIIPATRISAAELQQRSRSEEEFGVDNPQTTLVILQGQHRTQVNIGARTTPGDQVFVRVVPQQDICVVDSELLRMLPASASDWRDTALVDGRKLVFDELVVSNASGAMRFQRDVTNRAWRMREPLKTSADNERIEDALQKLQALRITQFVTDDPNAEMESFGLQPAVFELAFRSGTNLTALIRFGKSLTNAPGQIYARRDNSVVSVPVDPLSAWGQPFSYFRDRHLITLPLEYSEVEVLGAEPFTLQRGSTNSWQIAGEKFPVDAALVGVFLNSLASIEIPFPGGFVKNVATPADFASYGLTSGVRQITFKLPVPAGGTNPVLKQVSFGTPPGGTNKFIYARRGEEESIFAVRLADFQQLPIAGWQLRDLRVWNFSTADLARIIARRDGKVRELVHNGTNVWAFGAGTTGVLENEPLEVIANYFGQLRATAWSARGEATRDPRFGFATNNLALSFELKSGTKLDLQFGGLSPAKYPYALVTLDGEPWVFEFSTALYHFMFLPLAGTAP